MKENNFPKKLFLSILASYKTCTRVETKIGYRMIRTARFEWRDRVMGTGSASLIAQVPSTMWKYLTPSILVFSFILQRSFGTPSEKFRNIWCRLILAVDSYLPRLRRLGVSGSLSISTGKTIVRTLSIEWKFHSTLPLSLTRCSSTTRIYLCDKFRLCFLPPSLRIFKYIYPLLLEKRVLSFNPFLSSNSILEDHQPWNRGDEIGEKPSRSFQVDDRCAVYIYIF